MSLKAALGLLLACTEASCRYGTYGTRSIFDLLSLLRRCDKLFVDRELMEPAPFDLFRCCEDVAGVQQAVVVGSYFRSSFGVC